jgi:hypothetical protein
LYFVRAAANNCAAALTKYKEVAQVKSTPQVTFNTAECEARLGKLVAALGNYRIAARQAADDRKAALVLREVPARIDDLEARIPKLTVTRGKGADTAAIELDGTEIGAAQLGSPIPVDPGTHTIVARVGSKEYLHETLKLSEKQAKTFDVSISVAPPVVEPAAHPQTGEPEPKPDEPSPEGKSRVPGAVVTSLGGAVLIAGLIMLAPRQSAVDKLARDCTSSGHCPVDDASTGDQGRLFTGLTEVLVPVGVVGVVVGAVLLAKSAPPKAKKSDDGDRDKEKTDGEREKKSAFWRSLQVVPVAPNLDGWHPRAPGASLGGVRLAGRF